MTAPEVKRTVISAQEHFQSGDEQCSREADELRET